MIATVLCLTSMLLPSAEALQPKAIRSAAEFCRPDSPSSGIQEAVDALPPAGGVVEIPPGTWALRRGLVLRPHVTLRGAGSTSVLTRGKQTDAKLTRPARKGETSVEVDSSDGFRPGQLAGILVADSTRTLVNGNHCGSLADKPTQKFGIEEQGKSDANIFVGNLCEGNLQKGIVTVGRHTQVSANLGSVTLAGSNGSPQ